MRSLFPTAPPAPSAPRSAGRRWPAALLLAVGLSLAAPGVATAAPSDAYLRLAHLSPDTPNVDVYVASVADPARSFTVPGVGYGAVSPYTALPAGAYVISMRGAGAPADSPAVISTSVDARPGGAYTVAGVGMSAALGLSVLTDDLRAPAPGTAGVRVLNGAASAPSVQVGPADGAAWAQAVSFGGDSPYVDVPAGNWTLKVSAAGRPDLRTPCDLAPNAVYTVLLVDRGGGLTAELLTDRAGSSVVPAGGVDAGYGGMADRVAGGQEPLGVIALAGALAGAVLVGAALAWPRPARTAARGR